CVGQSVTHCQNLQIFGFTLIFQFLFEKFRIGQFQFKIIIRETYMFEISQLKEAKLSDLQDIAQKLNVPKYRTLKKLDLVYKILDVQAANPPAVKKEALKDETPTEASNTVASPSPRPKKKRERIPKPANPPKEQQKMEFTDSKNDVNEEKKASDSPPQKNETPHKPKEKQHNKPNPRASDNANKQNTRPKEKDGNVSDNSGNNGNKDTRNRYREPDFEFDAIIQSEGVLDIMQDGYGFLRSSDYNYLSSPDDIY